MRCQLLLLFGLMASSPAWAKRSTSTTRCACCRPVARRRSASPWPKAVPCAAWTSTWARPGPTAASRLMADGNCRASAACGNRRPARPASATACSWTRNAAAAPIRRASPALGAVPRRPAGTACAPRPAGWHRAGGAAGVRPARRLEEHRDFLAAHRQGQVPHRQRFAPVRPPHRLDARRRLG